MRKSHAKAREEARRMFLTGEVETNSEIAGRLKVKPHTIGHWRREEHWDDLRRKVDVRAAEMLVEKLASETTSLNVRHFRFWELLLARSIEAVQSKKAFDVRDLERIAGIVDRAQKGQRLAKGLSTGETEQAIRAQGEAEMRRIVDCFIQAVQENVRDDEARDRIRRAILDSLPQETGAGTGEPGDPSTH